jgi:hypothetical protein
MFFFKILLLDLAQQFTLEYLANNFPLVGPLDKNGWLKDIQEK